MGGAGRLALEVGGAGPGNLVPGHQGSLNRALTIAYTEDHWALGSHSHGSRARHSQLVVFYFTNNYYYYLKSFRFAIQGLFIYVCVYIHIRVCVYICGCIRIYAHTLTDIYICMYLRGSLAFLPISQSEGPAVVVCILVEKDPGLPVSGSSLKMVSVLPRGPCVQKQERAGVALGVLPELRPVGWFLPRSLLPTVLCGSSCPVTRVLGGMGPVYLGAAELPCGGQVGQGLPAGCAVCALDLAPPLPPSESEDRKDRALQTDPQIVHFVRPSF